MQSSTPNATQERALGDAVSGTADCAGDMCAVAVAVRAATAKRVKDVRGATAKLRVGGANAGVDDVNADAGTGPVVGIGSAQGPVALVDAVKSPGRIV